MKNMYSSMLLCCLVTLALPSFTYAQEAGDMAEGEMLSCEQQAKDLGITDPQELADYIEECKSMTSEEPMDDMPEVSAE